MLYRQIEDSLDHFLVDIEIEFTSQFFHSFPNQDESLTITCRNGVIKSRLHSGALPVHYQCKLLRESFCMPARNRGIVVQGLEPWRIDWLRARTLSASYLFSQFHNAIQKILVLDGSFLVIFQ